MTHLLLIVIYLAFISLGLPDSLLGSAWPTMYTQFNVPLSYAGIISMIISAGTIISSLQSDRLTRKLGAGKVTALSVATTAAALFGFSVSHSFLALCLWAIPYGLGAGSVDAALNNYVALHYRSSHMSWLHCMWGIGATLGPYIMGQVLTGGGIWNTGYRIISIMQIVLTGIIVFSLPLWKNRMEVANSKENQDLSQNNARGDRAIGETIEETIGETSGADASSHALSLREIFCIPGAKEVMICFFCYCALESTSGLWAGTYLNLYRGVSAQTAASLSSMFYLGITIGRAINGFIAMKLNDLKLIRIGQMIMAIGVIMLFLPAGQIISICGFLIIGLGCAPVYPCIIHSTPGHFGADKSQAIIGVQMASAYTGSCLMPPIFGLIANHITVALLPVFQILLIVLMFIMHEKLWKVTAQDVEK